MKKVDVYIAGSMTGRRVKDVLSERRYSKMLLKLIGLTWYDPADNEGLENKDSDYVISNAFDKRRMNKFVSKDLSAVANSRCVLNINGDLPSEGATWEMAYAVFHRQIPVFLVAPIRLRGLKMTFTNILVDGIYKTEGAAIKAIKEYLK